MLALHFGKFPHFNAGKIDVGLKRLTTIRKNIAKNQIYAIAYRFIIAISYKLSNIQSSKSYISLRYVIITDPSNSYF